MKHERFTFVSLFCIFIVFTIACYYPSLTAPFYLDDQSSIQNNFLVKTIPSFDALTSLYPFRQLTYTTFALNHHFFGESIKAYHAVNIILHILVGVSVYLFASELMRQSGFDSKNKTIGLLTAFFFLIAPINSQSVIYTVQRGVLLVALFYTFGLYSYLKLRTSDSVNISKVIWIFNASLCFFLSMLSKQNAVTFPAACLLLEILIIRRYNWLNFKNLFVFGGGLFLAIDFWDFASGGKLSFALESTLNLTSVYTRWQYFTHQLVLIWVYISKYFYPVPLLLEYSLTPYTWEDKIVWLSALGHGLMLIIAIYFIKRAPVISFLILFYYLTSMVESGFVVVLPDLGFEHRAYLPGLAIAIGLGSIFSWIIIRQKPIGSLGALFLLSGYGYMIFERAKLWNDREAFYRHELSYTADNPRPYAMVSQLFALDNRIEMATKWIQMAIQVGLESGQLQGSLISQYMQLLYKQNRVAEANRIGIYIIQTVDSNNVKAEILITLARQKISSTGCEMAKGLIRRAREYAPGHYEVYELEKLCNVDKKQQQ